MKANINTSSTSSLQSRLGVCTWSLQPADPADLLRQLKAIGLPCVQVDLDPWREQPAAWSGAQAALADAGIQLVSGMFRTVGEDYTTLETIRRTGGVVPDATWEQNWSNLQTTVKTARRLGVPMVTFHAGFLPHEKTDPHFEKLLGRIRQIARLFAAEGIDVGFETGQESAEALRSFLEQLGEPNVGVNFDPANMLLYNSGDPIAALRTIGRWVKGVHLKDATVTKIPGNWGDEVPVGAGEVNWPAFFRTLDEVGYKGACCFEREAGTQRLADIQAGLRFARSL